MTEDTAGTRPGRVFEAGRAFYWRHPIAMNSLGMGLCLAAGAHAGLTSVGGVELVGLAGVFVGASVHYLRGGTRAARALRSLRGWMGGAVTTLEMTDGRVDALPATCSIHLPNHYCGRVEEFLARSDVATELAGIASLAVGAGRSVQILDDGATVTLVLESDEFYPGDEDSEYEDD